MGAATQAQIERAIAQIQIKPSGEKDRTQHVLEDGNVVSTQERIVKDVRYYQWGQPTPRNLHNRCRFLLYTFRLMNCSSMSKAGISLDLT